MYNKLFTPISIGKHTIKNRVVAALPPTFLAEPDGNITPQLLSFYKNLASKAPGVLITEPFAISNLGKAWPRQPFITEDKNFLAISELVERLRNKESYSVMQLYHGGINSLPNIHNVVLGPSGITSNKLRCKVQELTTSEIALIVNEYRQAATMAWNAGFQAIEINAADSSLLHQFMSPITNKRNDDYGFSNHNGSLFLKEVVNAVHDGARTLNIIVKMSMRDLMPASAGLTNSIDTAIELKNLGVNVFHLTEGLSIGEASCLHPYLRGQSRPAPFAEDSLIFRNETMALTIMDTSFIMPSEAEKQLSKNVCDFIALNRTIIREPAWVSMAMTNQPAEFYKKCANCLVCNGAVSCKFEKK